MGTLGIPSFPINLIKANVPPSAFPQLSSHVSPQLLKMGGGPLCGLTTGSRPGPLEKAEPQNHSLHPHFHPPLPTQHTQSKDQRIRKPQLPLRGEPSLPHHLPQTPPSGTPSKGWYILPLASEAPPGCHSHPLSDFSKKGSRLASNCAHSPQRTLCNDFTPQLPSQPSTVYTLTWVI